MCANSLIQTLLFLETPWYSRSIEGTSSVGYFYFEDSQSIRGICKQLEPSLFEHKFRLQ